ncbi:hypothetical protein T492DRAFT_1027116 [Pavlovales sp. CCMP2436]|nr:hypothetical protein T492DRAFT_1027116 [Pavlovales sp. CCMP2436]
MLHARQLLHAVQGVNARAAAWGALGAAGLAVAWSRARSEDKMPDAIPPGATERHRIVVVGGGSAGISVAAQLLRKLGSANADLAIVEPADFHYYRPHFTTTAAGLVPYGHAFRPMARVMPRGARWIKAAALHFDPEHNVLVLENGARVEYDFLVVATGMRMDMMQIKGLEAALEGDCGVSTIWDYRWVRKVWAGIRNMDHGVALFTQQYTLHSNVFALGDSANVPTSRTIAAITAQAPVLVQNLIINLQEEGHPASTSQLARYDGYTSSPILTKRGGLILAEFRYDGVVKETFPYFFDQSKEVSILYILQTGFFPWAYWNLMLTGRWYGPRGLFEPRIKFVDTWAMP